MSRKYKLLLIKDHNIYYTSKKYTIVYIFIIIIALVIYVVFILFHNKELHI